MHLAGQASPWPRSLLAPWPLWQCCLFCWARCPCLRDVTYICVSPRESVPIRILSLKWWGIDLFVGGAPPRRPLSRASGAFRKPLAGLECLGGVEICTHLRNIRGKGQRSGREVCLGEVPQSPDQSTDWGLTLGKWWSLQNVAFSLQTFI